MGKYLFIWIKGFSNIIPPYQLMFIGLFLLEKRKEKKEKKEYSKNTEKERERGKKI